MTKIYSKIFKLNNYNDLSSLDTLSNTRFEQRVSHTEKDRPQIERMSSSEKHFFYTWERIDGTISVSLPGIIDTSMFEVRYRRAIANLEYPKKRKKDENGTFLTKEERVNNVEVEVVFFEKDNILYALILTSNEYNISRVKKLIGINNLAESNENYTLVPDVFNWLFYIYTERQGQITEDTKLENINGFVGNVTDAANIFTSTSIQTTELVVTKAFISNGGELKQIAFRVRDEEVDINCMIDENSTVVLNTSKSEVLRIMNEIEKSKFLLIYLYGYLISQLNRLYSEEANDFITEDHPKFSKKIGLEVIRSIIEKNDINEEELQTLYDANVTIQRID